MKNKFLTINQVLMLALKNIFIRSRVENTKKNIETSNKYKLINKISLVDSGRASISGVFREIKSKKRVFIKNYRFLHKDLRYRFLLNEISFLELFKQLKLNLGNSLSVMTPNIKEVIENENEITIIENYIYGSNLLYSSSDIKIKALKSIISEMERINNLLLQRKINLPKRNIYLFALTFIYFWFILSFKEPTLVIRNLKILIEFYYNFLLSNKEKKIYGIVHRDLHSENILKHKS